MLYLFIPLFFFLAKGMYVKPHYTSTGRGLSSSLTQKIAGVDLYKMKFHDSAIRKEFQPSEKKYVYTYINSCNDVFFNVLMRVTCT